MSDDLSEGIVATEIGTEALAELKGIVEKEVREDLEKQYKEHLDNYKKLQEAEMKKMVSEAIEEWKKSQQPPTEDDIRKLLSQEYLEFEVIIPYQIEDGSRSKKKFTICELPQAIEKKFYASIKKELVPRAKDFAALTFNLLEGDAAVKLVNMLEAFEPTFDLMAEACVLILNPFDKDKDVTVEWVQRHLSSSRMYAIIKAQTEVNRLRDFFSQAFLSQKSLPMTV